MKNNYQQVSRVLYTFVLNKPFGHLDISPKNFIFLKIFDSEFFYKLKYGSLIKILNNERYEIK